MKARFRCPISKLNTLHPKWHTVHGAHLCTGVECERTRREVGRPVVEAGTVRKRLAPQVRKALRAQQRAEAEKTRRAKTKAPVPQTTVFGPLRPLSWFHHTTKDHTRAHTP